MATTETKILDDVIASRRALLLGGGALAALALVGKPAHAAQTVTTYSDADILNFALNLEYLEANFYYMAAFGTTIDVPNAGLQGCWCTVDRDCTERCARQRYRTQYHGWGPAPCSVPLPACRLRRSRSLPTRSRPPSKKANTSSCSAARSVPPQPVAQPNIDISPAGAFTAVANAAGITGLFNPYASDANFLVGAYIFEDVGRHRVPRRGAAHQKLRYARHGGQHPGGRGLPRRFDPHPPSTSSTRSTPPVSSR